MTFIIHQLHRIQHRKMYFILSVTMTILAIVASLYFSTHQNSPSATALIEIGEASSVSWQLETFAHQPQFPTVSEAEGPGSRSRCSWFTDNVSADAISPLPVWAGRGPGASLPGTNCHHPRLLFSLFVVTIPCRISFHHGSGRLNAYAAEDPSRY